MNRDRNFPGKVRPSECACFGCTAPKRHPGCHATCEGYKAYKDRAKEIEDRRQEKRLLDQYIYGRTIDRIMEREKKIKRGGYH